MGPSVRDAPPAPRAPGADRGRDRLHGRTPARAAHRGRPGRGRGGGPRRLPRPAAPGAQRRGGCQGSERAALAGGDLCRDRPRAARPQRRMRIRVDHARMQQLLLLLRGALHARRRAQPRPRNHRRRGRDALRQRLPRGDAAGAERQFVPLRRGRFPRAAAPHGLRVAAAARALRHVAPQRHERPAARNDGLHAQHLPRNPSSGAVGRLDHAAPHEPQVRPRMVPGPLHARLRHHDRPDRGFLGRDGGGARSDALADARSGV